MQTRLLVGTGEFRKRSRSTPLRTTYVFLGMKGLPDCRIASAPDELSYRLPKTVVPRRYDLSLTPDLTAFTFDGRETVTVDVTTETSEIVLNAVELEIFRVGGNLSCSSIATSSTMPTSAAS